MSVVDQSNISLYPDQALAALEMLETLLARQGLDAQVDQALRLVPGKRAIFRGRFEGADAVFRLPLDESSRKAFHKEWKELKRAHAYMATGPCRVVEPLNFAPDTGLTIIAHVPGRPLLHRLRRLSGADAMPLVGQAAEWLNRYTAPTVEQRPFNAAKWLERATTAATRQTHTILKPVEDQIAGHMARLAGKLARHAGPAAICHGDFHFGNLILDGDTLTGIDTGGSAYLPVTKDMARALTHAVRRGVLPSGQRRFGVDAGSLEAFVTAFNFPEAEPEAALVLPFMIAFETLFRVDHPQMSDQRIGWAHEMSQGLLADLAQIA